MNRSKSQQSYLQAQQVIPGGVNSPVRSFSSVGGTPPFIDYGTGAYLVDIDGNRYLDYVMSWGPLILGHAHPDVIRALTDAAHKGTSYGMPTTQEVELASLICEMMPSMEMVRLVSSGTEATMTAIRLARAATGRDKFIKFAGCYHGHADALLVNAGSGALTFGVPSSPGVPRDFVKHTLTAEFNQLDTVTRLFEQYPDDISSIILEPVTGNMNCVLPAPGFLQGLREVCDQYGALLIFDEVMTGFRVSLGGAQAYAGVKPDLTTLGKVIGGGLPVGAYGGRKDLMAMMSPAGPVYQAGTLSGNPLAVSAGLITLQTIRQPGFFEELTANTTALINGLKERAQAAGVPMLAHQAGSMFGLFFTDQTEITQFDQVKKCDMATFNQFFQAMLDHGVHLAPSGFEAGFTSIMHQQQQLDETFIAFEKSLARLKTSTLSG